MTVHNVVMRWCLVVLITPMVARVVWTRMDVRVNVVLIVVPNAVVPLMVAVVLTAARVNNNNNNNKLVVPSVVAAVVVKCAANQDIAVASRNRLITNVVWSVTVTPSLDVVRLCVRVWCTTPLSALISHYSGVCILIVRSSIKRRRATKPYLRFLLRLTKPNGWRKSRIYKRLLTVIPVLENYRTQRHRMASLQPIPLIWGLTDESCKKDAFAFDI